VVTDVLPDQVGLIETVGCAEDPSGVSECSLGDLVNGDSISYTITVQVNENAFGEIVNIANVTAETVDPVPDDNVDGVDIVIFVEIPTLNLWGLLLMIIVLVMFAGKQLRAVRVKQ